MRNTLKKSLAIIVALALCLTAFMGCLSVSAADANTVKVTGTTINVGDATATATIKLESTGFAAAMLDVSFTGLKIAEDEDDLLITASSSVDDVTDGAVYSQITVQHNSQVDGEASASAANASGTIRLILDAAGTALGWYQDATVTITFNTASLAAGTYEVKVTSVSAGTAGTYDPTTGTYSGTTETLLNDFTVENGSVVVHEHDYSIADYDATGHWSECVCGDVDGFETHTLGEATEAEDGKWYESCVCGYSVEVDAPVTECEHANTTIEYDIVDSSYITKKVCSSCDNEEIIATVSGIKFGHSLNIQSDISINYVVAKTSVEKYGTALKAVFNRTSADTGKTATTTITDYVEYSQTAYWNFQYQGVAACEIADAVTAKLYATVDGVDILLYSEEYNILSYVDSQISKDSPNTKLCTFLMNMVRYASAAQVYFGYNENNLVQDLYTDAIEKFVTEPDRTEFTSIKATNGDTVFGAGLNLSGKVSTNIVYKIATYTGETDNLSLKLSYYDTVTKETVVVEGMVSELTGLSYGDAFKGLALPIPAAQFSAVITAELLDNGVSTGCSFTYSVESYAESKYTGDGSALSNLCLTMMAYSDSAVAYYS